MKDHTTAEIFEELWKRIEYDANVSEELASESNELQDRINRAIEYIKRYEQINGYYDSCYDGEYDTYSHDNVKKELLDILKGCDTNEK